MACFSNPISDERPRLFDPYRHIKLFAIILFVTPLLIQAAVSRQHISTAEAMQLLTSPGLPSAKTPDIDYNKEEAAFDALRLYNLPKSKNRMNVALYPTKDQIPDVNSPQVKAWVDQIDWSKVPNIPVASGTPEVKHFPKCPPDSEVDPASCWWSCSGCVAPEDVITCPDRDTWGLTYDDGPSPATMDMIKHLETQKLTATFFIVGSRVLEYPEILKEHTARGHHIAMHTWSHSGLTTLTNHQIVAEIRWTEKIIRDVTGLTMKYVRPPYGDTDNRVREIFRQMGYTTVIWTKGWDTNDWRMLQKQVQEHEIIQSFQSALTNRVNITSAQGLPAGPITLEHDLTEATISLSKRLIPMAMDNGLKPMNIATCLNDQTPYQRGSKLGPNGAVEKINDGEGKGHYRGMPGMEEQDFSSDVANKDTSQEQSSAHSLTTPNGILQSVAMMMAVCVVTGLTGVALLISL